MSTNIVNQIKQMLDELAKAVEDYKKEQDPIKKNDLLVKIFSIRSDIELLLTQLTRI